MARSGGQVPPNSKSQCEKPNVDWNTKLQQAGGAEVGRVMCRAAEKWRATSQQLEAQNEALLQRRAAAGWLWNLEKGKVVEGPDKDKDGNAKDFSTPFKGAYAGTCGIDARNVKTEAISEFTFKSAEEYYKVLEVLYKYGFDHQDFFIKLPPKEMLEYSGSDEVVVGQVCMVTDNDALSRMTKLLNNGGLGEIEKILGDEKRFEAFKSFIKDNAKADKYITQTMARGDWGQFFAEAGFWIATGLTGIVGLVLGFGWYVPKVSRIEQNRHDKKMKAKEREVPLSEVGIKSPELADIKVPESVAKELQSRIGMESLFSDVEESRALRGKAAPELDVKDTAERETRGMDERTRERDGMVSPEESMRAGRTRGRRVTRAE